MRSAKQNGSNNNLNAGDWSADDKTRKASSAVTQR
jgi:hypothetical protein|tara:strand:+ start:129 stop:233 length:105 start_codon:yes stop_codon:yes gene_type:complete